MCVQEAHHSKKPGWLSRSEGYYCCTLILCEELLRFSPPGPPSISHTKKDTRPYTVTQKTACQVHVFEPKYTPFFVWLKDTAPRVSSYSDCKRPSLWLVERGKKSLNVLKYTDVATECGHISHSLLLILYQLPK